jgi:hypothetical protein
VYCVHEALNRHMFTLHLFVSFILC